MSAFTVVGRVGHMEDGEVVTDEVTVQVVEADGTVGEGTAADEKEAVKAALANISERRDESDRRKAAALEAKRLFIEEIRNG